jgi:NTP pyrophosphatase (non-canonical NTP hydrolase)
MNTVQLIETCYNAAKAKGFWDTKRNMPEAFALILSELNEALDAHRKGKFADLEHYKTVVSTNKDFSDNNFKCYIKDTLQDELADVLIRCFDFCGGFNFQLNENFILWGSNDIIFKNTNNIGEKILRINYISTKYYYEVSETLAIASIIDYVMYLCKELNIDIEKHIELKLQYNATRGIRHGANY